MEQLQNNLGYHFKNPALLARALTHSSYANERHVDTGDNERLEFLGDSVLGFITAEYLFANHRDFPEGELTKLRAYAVCEKSLFSYAEEIGLGNYLKLGKGEERTGGRTRPSVLSDAFEAVIAAIYLDGGMDEAKNSSCALSCLMLKPSPPLKITKRCCRKSSRKTRAKRSNMCSFPKPAPTTTNALPWKCI